VDRLAARPAEARRPASRSTPALVLVAGSVLVFVTFMRYSLALAGWVVFAPFLAFLHDRATVRRHLVLLGTIIVAFLVAVSKMATAEIPWTPVPMFAIPIAVSYFAAVAMAALAHRRLGLRWGIWTFAATTVVLGWVQYRFTAGSSWGALAHTQLDDLPLVQLAALTGIGGLTFLVALGSGLTAAAWSAGIRAIRTDLVVFAFLVVSAFVYGELRLGNPAPGKLVRIGAVVSPVTHQDFHDAMADVERLRTQDDELFARSRRAVDLGAQVVVWNEMATVVSTGGESGLAARGQAFARERGVTLLMAYGVERSLNPLRIVNKYRIYLPNGSLADEYVKRHPVPGDPDDAGEVHARVVDVHGIRITGAICYDYGFPGIARDNARDGADLVLVPSSDWRGIDPEHARMSLMNAVAVGLPMMRPARSATSIATDQYGRVLGSMRSDGLTDGVLVVAVPAARLRTLYARTGEALPMLGLVFCALVVVLALSAR